MDVFEAAKNLGTMIANSDKMTRLKNAEANLESDTTAVNLMDKYKELQIKVVRATKARVGKEELDALKEELVAHQKTLDNNTITREYLESKADFDNFIKTINQVIQYSMTGDGEEGCSPSKCGGCSGGCH